MVRALMGLLGCLALTPTPAWGQTNPRDEYNATKRKAENDRDEGRHKACATGYARLFELRKQIRKPPKWTFKLHEGNCHRAA